MALDSRIPRRVRTTSRVSFTNTPPSSNDENEAVIEQVQELAEASAPCVQGGDCSVSVAVSGGTTYIHWLRMTHTKRYSDKTK